MKQDLFHVKQDLFHMNQELFQTTPIFGEDLPTKHTKNAKRMEEDSAFPSFHGCGRPATVSHASDPFADIRVIRGQISLKPWLLAGGRLR
jgi:hypothetical protein